MFGGMKAIKVHNLTDLGNMDYTPDGKSTGDLQQVTAWG